MRGERRGVSPPVSLGTGGLTPRRSPIALLSSVTQNFLCGLHHHPARPLVTLVPLPVSRATGKSENLLQLDNLGPAT